MSVPSNVSVVARGSSNRVLSKRPQSELSAATLGTSVHETTLGLKLFSSTERIRKFL